MKKSAFSLLALLALLVAMAAGTAHAAMFPAGTSFHLEKANCALCHLAGKNVTAQKAGILTSSQEALCGQCHPAAVQVSHPSGLQPKAAPPALYPLDWKGDLTCSTCHLVHGSSAGLMRGAKRGRELCFACHEAGFFKKMHDGGISLMAGHLVPGVDRNTPTLDAYSRKCMECHADNESPRLSITIDRHGIVRHATRSVNHPIGVSYQAAAAFGGYRARQAVESKMLLPGGMLSCVSCHSGYKTEHGKLIVTNARNALCYECHNL